MKLTLNLICLATLALSVAAKIDINQARQNLYQEVDFAQEQFYDKYGKIRDDVFDKWSESQLKAWADVHGVKVPQPGKKSELQAFVRKNSKLLQDDIDHFKNEAEKTAQPFVGKATEAIIDAGNNFFDSSIESWKDSRIKAFLDARGITTPDRPNRDKLIQLAKENKNKAATHFGSWSLESWSAEDLQKWLKEQGQKAKGSRDDLIKSGEKYLQSVRGTSEDQYKKLTDSIAQSVKDYRANTFEKWSDSDLKAYLDTYGIKTYQGTKRNELIAHVRSQYHLFTHGANPDSWTKFKNTAFAGGQQVLNNLKHHGNNVLDWGNKKAEELYNKAAAYAETVKAEL